MFPPAKPIDCTRRRERPSPTGVKHRQNLTRKRQPAIGAAARPERRSSGTLGSEPRNPVTVAVIDGHTLLHEAVRSILAQRDDMVLTAVEISTVRGLQAIRETIPDVVMIDASLPDRDGLVFARNVLREHPAAKVVMLTMNEDEGLAFRALDVGVKAYVFKRSPVERFVQAIIIAAQGGTYLDPSVAQKLLGSMRGGSGSLTLREADAVCRIVLGCATAEVAEQIGLSAKTGHTCRTRACHKLGLKTGAELFRDVTEQGSVGSHNLTHVIACDARHPLSDRKTRASLRHVMAVHESGQGITIDICGNRHN